MVGEVRWDDLIISEMADLPGFFTHGYFQGREHELLNFSFFAF